MRNAKDRVIGDALALEAPERADIATRLLASLDDPTTEPPEAIEQVWATEITRRCAELDFQGSELTSWDDLRRKLQLELQRA